MVKTKTRTKTIVAIGLVTVAAGSLAFGFYYYGARILRNQPSSLTATSVTSSPTPKSCTSVSQCGLSGQWSCVNNQCKVAVCGDGFCNICEFSPCEPTSENPNNCPKDCGIITPAPTPSPSSGIIDITHSGVIGSASKPLFLNQGQWALYKYVLDKSCSDFRVSEYNQENSPGIDMVIKKDILINQASDKAQLEKIDASNASGKCADGVWCGTNNSCANHYTPPRTDPPPSSCTDWYKPQKRYGGAIGAGNQVRMAGIGPGTYYIGLYYANRTGIKTAADYMLQVREYKCASPTPAPAANPKYW